jgi:hypothetical protein
MKDYDVLVAVLKGVMLGVKEGPCEHQRKEIGDEVVRGIQTGTIAVCHVMGLAMAKQFDKPVDEVFRDIDFEPRPSDATPKAFLKEIYKILELTNDSPARRH